MMSGPGTRSKGKPLVQSKLSFTSTSKRSAGEKRPEAVQSGVKRKFEPSSSTSTNNMDEEKRAKALKAAEERRNVQAPDTPASNPAKEPSSSTSTNNTNEEMRAKACKAAEERRSAGVSDTLTAKSDKDPSASVSNDNSKEQQSKKPAAADENKPKNTETKKHVHLADSSEPIPDGSSTTIREDGEAPSTSGAGQGQAAGDTQQYDMSDSQDRLQVDSDNMNDSQYSYADDEEAELEPDRKPSSWDNKSWKGKPLDKLNAAPYCLPPDLRLDPGESHDILIKLPFDFSKGYLPTPYPSCYQDRWDGDHVRMPCSKNNEYPTEDGRTNVKLEKRWELIKQALKGPIPGSFELEEAILSYNQRYANKWNFTVLHYFFTDHLKKADREQFFDAVLPLMVKLALKLPYLCTKSVPLLKKGRSKKLTLSQQQIACLLANAFFCTFPRRNSRSRTAEFSTYPDINFNNLFQGQPVQRKLQKLQCIVHYFKRVVGEMPRGIVTFSRQTLPSSQNWRNNGETLMELHVSSTGTIEDNGIGMLQVDFANKYLGGGVLGHGCVQEEIRFVICPEMIVSRLFTEVLGEMESLIMTGCEQFSEYEGYADTFKWKRNIHDKTERDSVGRLCCEVVAIDALVFRNDYNRQFKMASIIRELNKAFCGFMKAGKAANKAAVCTGNWGCGAFGGDKQLKSLIQLMAASAAKRDVCYFTFEDDRLTSRLYKVHLLLQREEKNISDILQLIEDYNREAVQRTSYGKPKTDLFEFIHAKIEGTLGSQDSSFSGADFDDDSNEAQAHGVWDTSDKSPDKSPDYKADTP